MQFYALMDQMSTAALRFDAVEQIDAQGLLLGEVTPDRPISFRRDRGRIAFDLLGETYGKLRLISPRFRSVLKDNGFTGWGTFPVSLPTDDEALSGYVGLSVSGRSGPIDRTRSQLIDRLTRGKERGVLYAEVGLYLDPDTWDGSDLFVPDETSIVCVTPDVKTALEDAGVTNARFVPNEAYELGLRASKSSQ